MVCAACATIRHIIGVSWPPVSPISLNKPLWRIRSQRLPQVADKRHEFDLLRAAVAKNLAGLASPAYESGRAGGDCDEVVVGAGRIACAAGVSSGAERSARWRLPQRGLRARDQARCAGCRARRAARAGLPW